MTVMPVDPHDKQRVIQLNFCGEICELWADGALYLPSHKTLVVSDLHFEKGHAQSTASPLPRYDTDMTLSKLLKIVDKSNFSIIVEKSIYQGKDFKIKANHQNHEFYFYSTVNYKSSEKLYFKFDDSDLIYFDKDCQNYFT